MASNLKNLSDFCHLEIPNGQGMKVGICVAQWNKEITDALLKGAVETLIKNNVNEEDIITLPVPGTFELTLGCQNLLEYTDVDAVIAIGCVIQGDTRHFDFICNSVTQGITELNIKYNQPVVFGVLTVNNLQQALDRCGGSLGNKGDEAAVTAIQMIDNQKKLRKNYLDSFPE